MILIHDPLTKEHQKIRITRQEQRMNTQKCTIDSTMKKRAEIKRTNQGKN